MPVGTALKGAAVPAVTRIDAHYRKFLVTRWMSLVLRAMLVTSLSFLLVPGLLVCGFQWAPHALTAGWHFSFLSAAGMIFVVGPLLYLFSVHFVLRVNRFWITSPPAFAAKPSSASVLLNTFTLRVLSVLAANATFGLVYALAYTWTLNLRSETAELGWLNPTARHPWHGNERLWFLVLGNTLFFAGLGLRDVLCSSLDAQWPKRRIPFPMAVRRSLVACFTGPTKRFTLGHDASLAFTATAAYTIVYFAVRVWAWRAVVTYLPFARPFVINFVKRSRSNLTWSLAYHLFVLQLAALVALKPAVAVLNDYLTQPLNFASFTAKSPLSLEQYLLAALESKNAFHINHTLLELQRVAHLPAARAAIFADTSRPAFVHRLWRALLVQLGQSYCPPGGRGAPAPSAPAPGTAPVDPHSIALKSTDIFRPAPKRTGIQAVVHSVLEGAPRPTPAPVVAAAEHLRAAEHTVARRIEARKPALEQWLEGTPVCGPLLAAVKLVRGGYVQWTGTEWAHRAVRGAIPEPHRLACLVDILSTLIVASADEDTYGYVQAVLPSTLEACVRLRAVATKLEGTLLAAAPNVSADAAGATRAEVAAIVATIDTGLLEIMDRFGQTLTAFRFPPQIANALTEISRNRA